MNLKQQLILRHKNPIGLVLRVITYLGIAIGLWFHHLVFILILVVADILNWFCMPMVQPKNEIDIIKKIVTKEITWIRSPWNSTKIATVIMGVLILVFSVKGLWMHILFFLVATFILLIILKQLILK
jgi:hypothetical protein